MGNQQSNENTRKRRIYIKPKTKKDARIVQFKVIQRETNASFIRFNVNDYVSYKDGDYKYIDISIDLANRLPVASNDIIIDLNYTLGYNSIKTFEMALSRVPSGGGG
ncbi:18392_t:CDS:2, partial [Funneliformis geosporum]